MFLYVLNRNTRIVTKIGIIERFQSCIWNPMYYGQGAFELIVPATPEYVDMLQIYRLLVRDEDESLENNDITYRNVMVITHLNYSSNTDNGQVIKVTGVSLKSYILGSRVINGYEWLSGNAEQEIYRAVKDQLGGSDAPFYRQWPGFKTAPLKGLSGQTDIQLFGENLAEWMEETCKEHQYGWDLYITARDFVFELYKGTDRTESQSDVLPIIFSKENDNLVSSELDIDYTDYATNAMVAASNEDSTTGYRIYIVTPYPIEYPPIRDGRFEIFIDSSVTDGDAGSSLYAALNAEGLQEIAQRKLVSFTAEIVPDGIYKLNRDYFMGDVVEVITEYGIKAKARIIDIIYSTDESGTSVVPTFSDWEVM